MNKLIKFSFVCILLINSKTTSGQLFYPATVAICKKGILTGHYKEWREGNTLRKEQLQDTISIEDAKSIFIINIIDLGTSKNIYKYDAAGFQMAVLGQRDTTIIKGGTTELNKEMKRHLSKIRSGDRLIFEDIRFMLASGEFRHGWPVVFIIK